MLNGERSEGHCEHRPPRRALLSDPCRRCAAASFFSLCTPAVLVVKAADAAPPLPSPDEPAAKKVAHHCICATPYQRHMCVLQASSAEDPHWIRADGSWGCTALSTASGCTTKPDPAEVKVCDQ